MSFLLTGRLVRFVLMVSFFASSGLSASDQDDLLSSLLGAGGDAYERALPKEVYDAARGISLSDLNGDQVPEVVVSLTEDSVNDCVEVYEYIPEFRSLQKMVFQGGDICSFEKRGSYLVSKYRAGAKWFEDIYVLRNKKFALLFADACIGCGSISRKEYGSGLTPDLYVVTDLPFFEERTVLLARISSGFADVFQMPSFQSSLVSTLNNGDEVKVIKAEEVGGDYYVKVKSVLGGVKGWVLCEKIDKCDLL